MQNKGKKSSRPEAAHPENNQCKVNILISLKAHPENNQCHGEEEKGQQREMNPLRRRT